jgi:diguanylate cyclase
MNAPLNPTEIARQALLQLASRRLAPTPDNYEEIYYGISGVSNGEAAEPIDRKLAQFASGLPDDEFGKTTRKLLEEALSRRDWNSARRAMLALARHSNVGANNNLGAQNSPGAIDPGTTTDADANLPRQLTDSLRACLVILLESALPKMLHHAPNLVWEVNMLASRVREAQGTEAFARLGADLREFTRRIELQGGGDAKMREGLLRLLRLLIENIDALVEGDHWIQGQLAIVKAVLDRPLTPEVLDQAEQAIKDLMAKQSALRRSVDEAKENIKTLLQEFMARLVTMTESTGDYQSKLESSAEKLAKPLSIETMNAVLLDLIQDTRDMKASTEASHNALSIAQERVKSAELRIQQMEQELEQLTERVREDALTGTLNRRGLDDAFKREAGRADRQNSVMCVAVVDIDNFKQLNDSLGHSVGDQALQHISAVIKEHLRPADALARYGGEEFVVLLPDSDIKEAVAVMTRLQRELTKRFFLHNQDRLLITFSCGVAQRQPGEELEPAVRRADRAMYQAKRAGKNRVVADDSTVMGEGQLSD